MSMRQKKTIRNCVNCGWRRFVTRMHMAIASVDETMEGSGKKMESHETQQREKD